MSVSGRTGRPSHVSCLCVLFSDVYVYMWEFVGVLKGETCTGVLWSRLGLLFFSWFAGFRLLEISYPVRVLHLSFDAVARMSVPFSSLGSWGPNPTFARTA
jgi:hypothetical protein